MAPSKVAKNGKKQARTEDSKKRHTSLGDVFSSRLQLAGAVVAVAVGVYCAHIGLGRLGISIDSTDRTKSSDGSVVTVGKFVDAGSVVKLSSPGTNLTESSFRDLLTTSSLYDARNGKELRSWRDIAGVQESTRPDEPILLQGPRRAQASLRHFVWPAGRVGERFEVADVPRPPGQKEPLMIETISDTPRVFYIHNFLSKKEADHLIAFATSKDNPYSVRRSTTGHKSWTETDEDEDVTSSTRTSENGFDISSPTARVIKKRAWELLRMSGKYDESLVDGLQILRYKQRQAYIAHHDYFDVGTSNDHNWDPSNGGTNRLATVLLYLSDVEEGGQTVFPYASRTGVGDSEGMTPPAHAAGLFKDESWEKEMVKDCYSDFAVKPRQGSAILFYSQIDGKLDPKSLHGGCPVINGTKWAANLWFWNQCRYGQCQPEHAKLGVRLPR